MHHLCLQDLAKGSIRDAEEHVHKVMGDCKKATLQAKISFLQTLGEQELFHFLCMIVNALWHWHPKSGKVQVSGWVCQRSS